MSITAAIQKIRQAGFTIEADGDAIAIEPFDELTDVQVGWLKSNKPDILTALRSEGAILEADQAGNEIEVANDPKTIMVEAWTPAGTLMMVPAESSEHAAWIERMNPPPIPAPMVQCSDCQHAAITNGIASCGAGVASGMPVGGFWATDAHLCESYWGILP